MLEHGGRLRAAAARYGVPLETWLDLSTGINPLGWPVPDPPPEVWRRLPEEGDDLELAAAQYYGCASLLPVAGSQAAIQALPFLRTPGRVAVLQPTYAEHAYAWRHAGHEVCPVTAETVLAGPDFLRWDTLVLVNPNNPTGIRFPREILLAWRQSLAERGGWLVVDEAYMDVTPEASLASCCPRPGLILLRSLGKFFGLAGARVGFVLGEPELLGKLAALLGPWAVAGPSRWAACVALSDLPWQIRARQRLELDADQLAALLCSIDLPPVGGCALFQWCPTPHAADLHASLAGLGILTRHFPEQAGLRFGLPGNEMSWKRLELALELTSRKLMNP